MKAPAWAARTLPIAAGIAVAFGLAAAGWQGYRYLAARPVRNVVFTGDAARIAPAELRALALDVRATTSLAAMRERARRVPWVRDAAVRRQFPDGVEIQLEAYDAVARWNDDALLSSRGEIFRAPYAGALMRVRAPDAMAPAIVAILADVRKSVAPIATPISEIAVSARGAWRVTLASGLVLEVGRADIAPRIERFAAAWTQLAAAGTQTQHADLRYANGFALKRAAAVQVPSAGVRPAAPSTPTSRKKK